MHIQIYKNLYSGYKDITVDSWDFVIQAIKSPQNKYYDRELIPLWSFYTPIDEPSLNDNDEPRGCADNMRQFNALQIDFDDNVVRIDDFCEKYKNIRYFLYTSFRHSENHHKFRVILPLDGIYGNKLMSCPDNKELLLEMFPGCDKSTINSFRKQRIPALDPTHAEVYQYRINDDKPAFSLPFLQLVNNYNAHTKQHEQYKNEEIETRDELPEWCYNIEGLYVPRPSNIKENVKISVINAMDNLPWGNRGGGIVHYTLCKLYGKLKTCGFSSYDAENIMLDNAPRQAHKEIMDICKLN